MIKITNNKNESILLKYYHIEKYCINEINKNKKDIANFNEFNNKYSYFNPYFDYIFHIKKYKLHEPLLIPNTILNNENRYYYIIEKDKEVINSNSYDFTLMDDIGISIKTDPYLINEGFFILSDGTMITNNFVERHLCNAKMILNNELIKSITIYNKYKKFINQNGQYFQYNIIDFLIESLGIIYGKKDGKIIKLTMNNKIITKKQLNTIRELKSKYYVLIEYCEDYKNPKKLVYKYRE